MRFALKKEICIFGLTLIAFLVTAFLYFKAEQEVGRVEELRYQSYTLADELRQSSDELTRMVRTYVATDDVRYKQYYQEILDIRNGKSPRPRQYTSIYWALKLADSSATNHNAGPAIPLRTLIKNSAFPDQELGKLLEAENYSNELAVIERDVMRLHDYAKKRSDVDSHKILLRLHDADYHRAKLKIMQPISELYVLMAKRTDASISQAKKSAYLMLAASGALLLAMLSIIFRAYTRVHRILGADAATIHAHLLRIGRGELNTPIKSNLSDSVFSHLSNMQNQLKQHIHEKTKIEDELRIAALAFESQEGIFITDADNLIIRVNRAFINITGYSAADVYGKNPSFFQSGRHDKNYYMSIWDGLKNTNTWTGEIWNCRKDGEVYPAQIHITAVRDEHGILKNYVATFVDITQRKHASAEIERLAFYDPLTKLPNRRLLMDRINQVRVTCMRNDTLGALLFIDLDHFKNLNDTLGHNVGDLLLQQVAGRISSSVREIDTVARIGGDEFVVLLAGLNKITEKCVIEVKSIIKQINTALKQPYQLDQRIHTMTCSIGIALFNEMHQSGNDLLKQADIAMYRAKLEGRNTFKFFDTTMQDDVDTRVRIEKELQEAIKQEQFILHYQVQVGSDGHPIGAEALIRWMHPNQGLLLPSSFIDLAEELHLIIPISKWVMNQACAQLKIWEQNELTRSLNMSVNISADYFYDINFISDIQNAIILHSINPGLLLFEITESVLIKDVERTIEKMHALNKMGSRISLDDFGTGYSSLQYLKKLPLQQLKIDKTFVSDIFNDTSDQMIARTIIMMAENMGLEVLAEGVETEEQQKFLLDNGCLKYQGYLFGRPMPIDDFERSLGIPIQRTHKI